MRIVIADCSVVYTGRGDTQLARAVRAIIIKDDGAISIHSDQGNKPLNYMGQGNTHTVDESEAEHLWVFDTRKESLQIRLHHVVSDTEFKLATEEPGLSRDGTEPQLQAWLALNPEVIEAGATFVTREYQTGAGPIDLLLLDEQSIPLAVEVKRTASLAVVGQVQRYLSAMREQVGMENVRGVIAALDIRPKTAELAAKRGILCVTLPRTWRNGEPTVDVTVAITEITAADPQDLT